MKTLEEVKAHVYENGYTEKAMEKICGFLVGAGIKDEGESLHYKKGDGIWDDFKKWYDNELPTNEDMKQIAMGSYVCVSDGIYVMALGRVKNNKFVGTDGAHINTYNFDKNTRLCNDEECDIIKKSLLFYGLEYDLEFIPADTEYDSFDDMEVMRSKVVRTILNNFMRSIKYINDR